MGAVVGMLAVALGVTVEVGGAVVVIAGGTVGREVGAAVAWGEVDVGTAAELAAVPSTVGVDGFGVTESDGERDSVDTVDTADTVAPGLGTASGGGGNVPQPPRNEAATIPATSGVVENGPRHRGRCLPFIAPFPTPHG